MKGTALSFLLALYLRCSFGGQRVVNGLFCGSKVRGNSWVTYVNMWFAFGQPGRGKETNVSVYFIGGCKRRSTLLCSASVPLQQYRWHTVPSQNRAGESLCSAISVDAFSMPCAAPSRCRVISALSPLSSPALESVPSKAPCTRPRSE